MPYRKVKLINPYKRCKIVVVVVVRVWNFFLKGISVCSSSSFVKEVSEVFNFPVHKQFKFPTCVRDFESHALMYFTVFSPFFPPLSRGRRQRPLQVNTAFIPLMKDRMCERQRERKKKRCCLISNRVLSDNKNFGRRENRRNYQLLPDPFHH